MRPAIALIAATPKEREQYLKLIKSDRKLLELIAARGAEMAAYANRRKELGL